MELFKLEAHMPTGWYKICAQYRYRLIIAVNQVRAAAIYHRMHFKRSDATGIMLTAVIPDLDQYMRAKLVFEIYSNLILR